MTPLASLKKGYVDAHSEYSTFLELVVVWILEWRLSTSKCLGLVCEVIRKANEVWFAVGVYTVCKILFLVGNCLFFFHVEAL